MPNPRLALAAILIPAVAVHAQPPDFSESGLFLRAPTAQYQQATQLKTELDIDVVGIVARVSVKQRFRNQSADWVEGVYVFPLPDDSAVDELSMTIGGRRIEGEIQEREQAKKTYEQARVAGQHASLPATATDAGWYQLIGIVIAALLLGLIGIWRLFTGAGR